MGVGVGLGHGLVRSLFGGGHQGYEYDQYGSRSSPLVNVLGMGAGGYASYYAYNQLRRPFMKANPGMQALGVGGGLLFACNAYWFMQKM